MEGIVNPVALHQSQVDAAYGCVAEYRKIVHVVVRFRGVTAWERDIYVCDVTDGETKSAYAWSHLTSEADETDDTDGSDEPGAAAEPTFTTMIDGDRVKDATTAVHEALRQRFAADQPVLPASA